LIIVGGGIAGSFMAYLEAKKGEKVVLYERNPNQEKSPKPCSGGVATMWLNHVGLEPPKDVIADEVTGYDIYFEGKEIVSYRGNRTILYILKRGYFERWLQQEAEKEGAKIIYKAFYPSEIPDEHLVLAEGAGGFVKKSMGLDEKRKLTDFHTGVQLIGETPNVEEHVVKIYLTKYASTGYAWVFPHHLGGEVGLGVTLPHAKEAWPYLYKWMEENGIKINPVIKQTHIIPTNYPQKWRYERVTILGDDAYMTNPLTGGGIQAALYSAYFASNNRSLPLSLNLMYKLLYRMRNRFLSQPLDKSARMIKTYGMEMGKVLDKGWEKSIGTNVRAIIKTLITS